MYFPEDVVIIIREFSQPITRPDWRTLHIMTINKFHSEIRKKYYLFDIPVINSLVKRYGETSNVIPRVESSVYFMHMFVFIIICLSMLGYGLGILVVPSYKIRYNLPTTNVTSS